MVPQILSFWNKLSNRGQTSHCLVMMRERLFLPPFITIISAQCIHMEAETPWAHFWKQHRPDCTASLHAFLLQEEDVWWQAGLTENMVNWCINEQHVSKQRTATSQKTFLSLTLRIRN